MPHLSSQVFHPLTCRLLPPLIPSSWLFRGGGWDWWWRGLNSTLKSVCVCVCVCMHLCHLARWEARGVKIWIVCVCVRVCVRVCGGRVGHARLWGRQLFWWISWHMHAMNYQATRVNYPKEKKRNMDPSPTAPGSLFQFREWFFPKCRGEEKRSSLEGARVGWWGVGKKKRMNETLVYVCPPSPTPDQIQNAKRSVKMQKAFIRPSERTNATYDGWVWDLERPSVKHRPFPLFDRPSLFPHLSYVPKPYQAPGWSRHKWKTFVINWSRVHIYLQCPLLFLTLFCWPPLQRKGFMTCLRTKVKVPHHAARLTPAKWDY